MMSMYLPDKLSPRQFSELVGIDREVVEVLYMAYAYNQEQYGPVVTGIDDYDVPIIDMFLFLYDQYREYYVTLDSNLDEKLTTLYDTLHDAQLQLQGSDYSRLVLNISLPVEGQEIYDALEEIRGIATQYYSKDSVICYDNIVLYIPVGRYSGTSRTYNSGKYMDKLCSSVN